MRTLISFLACIIAIAAKATALPAADDGGEGQYKTACGQVISYLVDKHVEYDKVYDAHDFGLPAPDSLRLKASDGVNVFAYEICPENPKGVVVCLSGIENPSVTAFYGHAAEFLKADVATIMPDLRGHGKSGGDRICLAYEETRDVKAVTDYIKSEAKYKDVPVIVMGVSMGGAVAIRSIGENEDIDALISLSAFSSIEDFFHAGREVLLPTIPAEALNSTIAAVVKEKYGVDAPTSSPFYALRGLKGRPVLLMHSHGDTQVPFACFEKILAEAAHYTQDIDTFIVEGDEHFVCRDFTHPASDGEYLRHLMCFVRKITAPTQK